MANSTTSKVAAAVLVLMLVVLHVASASEDVDSIAAPSPAPFPAVYPAKASSQKVEEHVTYEMANSSPGKFQVGVPLYRDRRNPDALIPAFKVEMRSTNQGGF